MARWLAIALLGCFASSAWAWNKAGHMVSAAIAFHVLQQESPATIPIVISILKEQPKFETQWDSRLKVVPNLTADEKDMYLFMLAARWADDVREDAEFHQSKWHYINLPFKPPGTPDSVTTQPPDPDNIIRAFEVNLGKVKDKTLSAPERAVALCWVFHLVGDAHQPLHTSNMFSTDFPRGDRGGNAFKIRVRPTSSVISLHQFWDDLILGSNRFQTVRNRATELRLRDDLLRSRLPELHEKSFENWVNNESFRLAKEVVYRHGALKGGVDLETAAVLPDDYPATTKPVAERRIVLAGYRLAQLLERELR